MDPTQQISIAGPPVQQEEPLIQVSPDNGTQPVPVSQEVAQNRANKVLIGLPSLGKSSEDLTSMILAGQEQELRSMAASSINAKKILQQENLIVQIANKRGSPLSIPESMLLRNIIQKKQADPDSVIEDGYAEAYMNGLKDSAKDNPDSFLSQAFQDIPNIVAKDDASASDLEAKKQWAITQHENAEAAVQAQSWGGYGADQLKMLVPFYNMFKLLGLAGDTSVFSHSLGTNLDAQASSTYFKPKDQFIAINKAIIDKLIKDNPSAAVMYTSALVGQSYNERMLNDLFPVLDLAGVGSLIKGSIKLGTRATEMAALNASYKTAVKQVLSSPETIVGKPAIAEASGNVAEAGLQKAVVDTMAKVSGKPTNPINSAIGQLQDIFAKGTEDIRTSVVGPMGPRIPQFSQEFYNKLAEQQDRIGALFLDKVTNTMKVERVPALFAVEKNLRILGEQMIKDYPGLNNTIMNISFRRDPLDKVLYADYYIGNKAGTTLFGTERRARAFITGNNLEKISKVEEAAGPVKADVKQKGAGFYVVLTHPVDETQPLIRSMLLSLKGTETPDRWLNAFGGWLGNLRTPEETLSHQQMLQRKVATYAQGNYLKVVEENSKEIKKLRPWALSSKATKQKWEQWKQVVDLTSNTTDPITGRRTLLRSPDDVAHFYENKFNRLPDEQEVSAYFAYKRNDEIQHVLANIEARKNLLRQGAETHTIRILDKLKETFTPGGGGQIPFKEYTVTGKRLNELPTERDALVEIGDSVGKEKLRDTGRLKKATKERITEELKKGEGVLIRLSNPEDRPLDVWSAKVLQANARPRYIYVRANRLETKPLAWEQIKQRPRDVDYEHYAKQAIIKIDHVTGKSWYEGDRTLAAFNVRAVGKDFVERVNKIREFLKNGDEDGARAYHKDSGLPQEWSEIKDWFTPKVSSEGLPTGPKLSLTEPLHVVPYNRTIQDLDKDLNIRNVNFKDGTREGFGRTAGKPDPDDLFTMRDEGTKNNPDYKISPAKYLDPVTSINRALNRTIDASFMNDYKIHSVEHWIQEAKQFLRTDENKLANKPHYYFHNPQWRNVAGDDIKTVNNLKTARMQILQFLGVQDQTTTFLHSAAQKLQDSVYESFGPKAAQLTPTWLLPTLRDPFAFVRSMTFQAKMGLFSIPQLAVQSQTFANIFGIAGFGVAAPATKAAMFHMWARVNGSPEILDHLDKLATRQLIPGTSKWRLGEWKEAHELLSSSGFERVAGEYALKDNTMYHEIIGSKVGDILNAGEFFFREGERNARTGSFYAAYREFRDTHPTGRISDADAKTILNRADLLSNNMSRASSSAITKGIFSIPTQFLAYQLRLMELMTGKRLTSTEKMRLFGTYSTLYGVPMAFGLSGFPAGDYIKKWANDNGYVAGDSYIQSMFAEGLPATMIALITGQFGKEQWLNIGERYSAQGFEPIKDSFQSNKTFWDIIGGATFSTIKNTWEGSSGFLSAMGSLMRGDGQFPIKAEDFVDPWREISSVNNTARLIAAINTNHVVSKKGGYIDDTTMGNAIFQYLSGLSPEGSSVAANQQWTMRNEKALQSEAMSKFIRQMRNGLTAMDNHDPQQATDYFKRARNTLIQSGYPEEEVGKAIAIAMQDRTSQIDSTAWDYYKSPNVSQDRKATADQAYIKFMQLKNK